MKKIFYLNQFIEGDFGVTIDDGGDLLIADLTKEQAESLTENLNKVFNQELEKENAKLKQVLMSIYRAFPEIDTEEDLNGGDAVDRLTQLWVDVINVLDVRKILIEKIEKTVSLDTIVVLPYAFNPTYSGRQEEITAILRDEHDQLLIGTWNDDNGGDQDKNTYNQTYPITAEMFTVSDLKEIISQLKEVLS
jgi:hypothetical protein